MDKTPDSGSGIEGSSPPGCVKEKYIRENAVQRVLRWTCFVQRFSHVKILQKYNKYITKTFIQNIDKNRKVIYNSDIAMK